jgi:hypothetical protein
MICAGHCAGLSPVQERERKMKTPGIYYGAIAAFCVIGILVGFAGAADVAAPQKNSTGMHNFGHGQLPLPEKIITRLEQQGVDVSEVRSALQNGDTGTVKSWLDAYREEHKGDMKPAHRMGNITPGRGQDQ